MTGNEIAALVVAAVVLTLVLGVMKRGGAAS
jgi:hypothetical protein